MREISNDAFKNEKKNNMPIWEYNCKLITSWKKYS